MSTPYATHPVAPFSSIHSVLQDDAWFRGCTPALQAALRAHGLERRLRAGESLFDQGEYDGHLYLLLDGALAVQSVDEHGHLSMLMVMEPFHWFGELSFIDGRPRSHDVVAQCDSRVWCVGRAGLQAELQARPEGWFHVARLMSDKMRLLLTAVGSETRGPLTMRVARRLGLAMQCCGWRIGVLPGQGQLRLSQEQLARMLGASRGSVNRALHDLQDAGVIRLHYGSVEVLDDEQLLRIGRLPRQD